MKSTDELKLLLVLLGSPDYRSPLTASRLNRFKTKTTLCQSLCDRGLVDFSREITTVKILPAGQALLKLETDQLPIAEKELKVLEKVAQASGKVTVSAIKLSGVKSDEKQAILQVLSDRGLLEANSSIKKAKAEVWLTQRGIAYLRDEYTPKGAAKIELDLLNNYLGLMRKALHEQPEEILPTNSNAASVVETTEDVNDAEILKLIGELDRELGTENYLPIFHLRQKLQPPLSREQLDQALYRLQRNDQIELRALVHAQQYTSEQVETGISQLSGSPLFFIEVTTA